MPLSRLRMIVSGPTWPASCSIASARWWHFTATITRSAGARCWPGSTTGSRYRSPFTTTPWLRNRSARGPSATTRSSVPGCASAIRAAYDAPTAPSPMTLMIVTSTLLVRAHAIPGCGGVSRTPRLRMSVVAARRHQRLDQIQEDRVAVELVVHAGGLAALLAIGMQIVEERAEVGTGQLRRRTAQASVCDHACVQLLLVVVEGQQEHGHVQVQRLGDQVVPRGRDHRG